MKPLTIAVVLLFSLIDRSLCQSNHFIANIVSYTLTYPPLNVSQHVYRCSASVISQRHVITAASCATVEEPLLLGVEVVFISAERTTATMHGVNEIFIHPEYLHNQSSSSDIAVVSTHSFIDTAEHPTRNISVLRPNTLCNLFGWGAVNAAPRSELVSIADSVSCVPNQPGIFCTLVSSENDAICSARLGSPLSCANGYINGIVLTNTTCVVNPNSGVFGFEVQYLAFDRFSRWAECIVAGGTSCYVPDGDEETTTLAGMTLKTSIVFILSSALVSTVLIS